ncbi:hypothetical protein CGC21_35780 [Leishmania donovani]|uniref:Uncharacterized protein n=1 Tax=Leishmania donovani TaxID=5661 RepID=A0A504XDV1_LEIDO|nr:hypothetical protein CGC21_35780 [Leishmania donovani]
MAASGLNHAAPRRRPGSCPPSTRQLHCIETLYATHRHVPSPHYCFDPDALLAKSIQQQLERLYRGPNADASPRQRPSSASQPHRGRSTNSKQHGSGSQARLSLTQSTPGAKRGESSFSLSRLSTPCSKRLVASLSSPQPQRPHGTTAAAISLLTSTLPEPSQPPAWCRQRGKEEIIENELEPVPNLIGLSDYFMKRPHFVYRPHSTGGGEASTSTADLYSGWHDLDGARCHSRTRVTPQLSRSSSSTTPGLPNSSSIRRPTLQFGVLPSSVVRRCAAGFSGQPKPSQRIDTSAPAADHSRGVNGAPLPPGEAAIGVHASEPSSSSRHSASTFFLDSEEVFFDEDPLATQLLQGPEAAKCPATMHAPASEQAAREHERADDPAASGTRAAAALEPLVVESLSSSAAQHALLPRAPETPSDPVASFSSFSTDPASSAAAGQPAAPATPKPPSKSTLFLRKRSPSPWHRCRTIDNLLQKLLRLRVQYERVRHQGHGPCGVCDKSFLEPPLSRDGSRTLDQFHAVRSAAVFAVAAGTQHPTFAALSTSVTGIKMLAFIFSAASVAANAASCAGAADCTTEWRLIDTASGSTGAIFGGFASCATASALDTHIRSIRGSSADAILLLPLLRRIGKDIRAGQKGSEASTAEDTASRTTSGATDRGVEALLRALREEVRMDDATYAELLRELHGSSLSPVAGSSAASSAEATHTVVLFPHSMPHPPFAPPHHTTGCCDAAVATMASPPSPPEVNAENNHADGRARGAPLQAYEENLPSAPAAVLEPLHAGEGAPCSQRFSSISSIKLRSDSCVRGLAAPALTSHEETDASAPGPVAELHPATATIPAALGSVFDDLVHKSVQHSQLRIIDELEGALRARLGKDEEDARWEVCRRGVNEEEVLRRRALALDEAVKGVDLLRQCRYLRARILGPQRGFAELCILKERGRCGNLWAELLIRQELLVSLCSDAGERARAEIEFEEQLKRTNWIQTHAARDTTPIKVNWAEWGGGVIGDMPFAPPLTGEQLSAPTGDAPTKTSVTGDAPESVAASPLDIGLSVEKDVVEAAAPPAEDESVADEHARGEDGIHLLPFPSFVVDGNLLGNGAGVPNELRDWDEEQQRQSVARHSGAVLTVPEHVDGIPIRMEGELENVSSREALASLADVAPLPREASSPAAKGRAVDAMSDVQPHSAAPPAFSASEPKSSHNLQRPVMALPEDGELLPSANTPKTAEVESAAAAENAAAGAASRAESQHPAGCHSVEYVQRRSLTTKAADTQETVALTAASSVRLAKRRAAHAAEHHHGGLMTAIEPDEDGELVEGEVSQGLIALTTPAATTAAAGMVRFQEKCSADEPHSKVHPQDVPRPLPRPASTSAEMEHIEGRPSIDVHAAYGKVQGEGGQLQAPSVMESGADYALQRLPPPQLSAGNAADAEIRQPAQQPHSSVASAEDSHASPPVSAQLQQTSAQTERSVSMLGEDHMTDFAESPTDSRHFMSPLVTRSEKDSPNVVNAEVNLEVEEDEGDERADYGTYGTQQLFKHVVSPPALRHCSTPAFFSSLVSTHLLEPTTEEDGKAPDVDGARDDHSRVRDEDASYEPGGDRDVAEEGAPRKRVEVEKCEDATNVLLLHGVDHAGDAVSEELLCSVVHTACFTDTECGGADSGRHDEASVPSEGSLHRSLASPCTECENSAQTSSSTAGKGQLKYDRSLDSDVLTPVARGLRQQCWEENSAAARLYKERAEEEHQLPAPHIPEFVWSVLAHQLQKRDVNAKTAAEAPGTTGTPCGGAAGKGTEWRRRGGEHYADCSREASSRGGFRDDGRASWSTEDSQPNSVPLTREHDTMQHGSFIPQRWPLPCDEVTRSSPAQNPEMSGAAAAVLRIMLVDCPFELHLRIRKRFSVAASPLLSHELSRAPLRVGIPVHIADSSTEEAQSNT